MEFVKVYNNVLPPILCEYLMKELDENEQTDTGVVGPQRKANVDIKNTMDLYINNVRDEAMKRPLINYIRHTITMFLKLYSDDINKLVQDGYVPIGNLEDYGFQIQRYTMNEGRYVFHNDFGFENDKHRVLTFLFYLNDVEEGGETEFYDGTKIKPEKGKLLIFPSCWTYVHRGNMPVSSDKYILTGWLYSD